MHKTNVEVTWDGFFINHKQEFPVIIFSKLMLFADIICTPRIGREQQYIVHSLLYFEHARNDYKETFWNQNKKFPTAFKLNLFCSRYLLFLLWYCSIRKIDHQPNWYIYKIISFVFNSINNKYRAYFTFCKKKFSELLHNFWKLQFSSFSLNKRSIKEIHLEYFTNLDAFQADLNKNFSRDFCWKVSTPHQY